MSGKKDDEAELSRRDVSKILLGCGAATTSGTVIQDLAAASDSNSFYKNHLQSLVEQKGPVEDANYAPGELTITPEYTGPPKCDTEFSPECGGGGGGGGSDTTTSGGGGGGGPTYYDPDATFYIEGKPIKNGKYRVKKGEDLNFNGSGSVDNGEGGSSIESYSWDFGDGSHASGATVTHSYSSAGDYSVTLTVTDDEGATDTYTEEVKAHAGYGIKYNHTSGTTPEEILIRGNEESAWLFEDGDLQSFSLGTLKEEVSEIMGSAEDQYRAASPNSPTELPKGTGEETLTIDDGNSAFEALMPDIGNDNWTIPMAESGFVGWSTSNKTVEVFTGAIVLANVWGYSEVYSEFKYTGSSEATVDFLFSGIDIDVKAHSTLGDVGGKFKVFINYITDQTRVDQNVIDTWDPGLMTIDFDGDYPIDAEKSKPSINSKLADYTLSPGYVYQVGIHMLGSSAALSTDVKTPAFAKFDGAHVDGNHEGSKGSIDNINDSSDNGMSVNDVSINW